MTNSGRVPVRYRIHVDAVRISAQATSFIAYGESIG